MTVLIKALRNVRQKGAFWIFAALISKTVRFARGLGIFIFIMKSSHFRKTVTLDAVSLDRIRLDTLSYIDGLRIKDSAYGLYRYSATQTTPVLYASLYAALTRHLYDDLDTLTEHQRREWINYIQSFQSEDGLFRDYAVQATSAEHLDWWGWRHLTLHAIMALCALGATAQRKFSLVVPFYDPGFMVDWLKARDWYNDPAATSNQVQNFFTIFQYARDFHGDALINGSLRTGYQYLNSIQNQETGLWGRRFDNPMALSRGVQTGYHIWLAYFYDKQPIQYMEKIIDSCLATQNMFGGFGVAANSSACEDIDSIDPLVRLSRLIDYRRPEIDRSLRKAASWVLMNRNPDGGYVFRRHEPFTYGHRLMSSGINESSLFATWFRTLSLAYLEAYFSDSFVGGVGCRFLACPGLQFWNFDNG